MKRPARALLDTNIVLSALKGQSSCEIVTADAFVSALRL